MFDEKVADGGIFGGVALFGFFNRHNIELPAGQVGGQAHVLAATADGQRQLVFRHNHINGVFVFVNQNAAHRSG